MQRGTYAKEEVESMIKGSVGSQNINQARIRSPLAGKKRKNTNWELSFPTKSMSPKKRPK